MSEIVSSAVQHRSHSASRLFFLNCSTPSWILQCLFLAHKTIRYPLNLILRDSEVSCCSLRLKSTTEIAFPPTTRHTRAVPTDLSFHFIWRILSILIALQRHCLATIGMNLLSSGISQTCNDASSDRLDMKKKQDNIPEMHNSVCEELSQCELRRRRWDENATIERILGDCFSSHATPITSKNCLNASYLARNSQWWFIVVNTYNK